MLWWEVLELRTLGVKMRGLESKFLILLLSSCALKISWADFTLTVALN